MLQYLDFQYFLSSPHYAQTVSLLFDLCDITEKIEYAYLEHTQMIV